MEEEEKRLQSMTHHLADTAGATLTARARTAASGTRSLVFIRDATVDRNSRKKSEERGAALGSHSAKCRRTDRIPTVK